MILFLNTFLLTHRILVDNYVKYVYNEEKEVNDMPMTPKEMIALLEANGFEYVSSNGSHRKYRNQTSGKTVIVPFHSKDLKPGTEKNILKAAGLR